MRISNGCALAIGAFATLMLAMPASARAHEKLKHSEPSAGAHLSMPPSVLRFSFSERPELALTRIVLRDTMGNAIRLAPPERDAADPLTVSVHVLEHLAPGTYVVTWTTSGSDGHPGSGKLQFEVLAPVPDTPSITNNSPATGLDSTAAPSAVATPGDPSFVALRTAMFIAVLLAIGAVIFRYVILQRSSLAPVLATTIERRIAVVGASAAIGLLVVAPLRLWMQLGLMNDVASGREMILATRWGTAWLMQVIAAALGAAAFMSARRARGWWTLALLCALTIAASVTLAGHAATAEKLRSVAIASDVLHIIGGAGWIGSLALLAFVAVPVTIASSSAEDRWTSIAALVNTFSPIALAFAALLAVTGTAAAWIHLRTVQDLWRTPYGLALLRKLIVLTGVLATGAYNWLRVRPALGTEAATTRVLRSASLELLLATVVVALTAVLVASDPPTQ